MGWFRSSKDDKPPPSSEAHAGANDRGKAARDEPMNGPPELFEEHGERQVPSVLADLFLVQEEHLTEIELEDTRKIVATVRQPPPLVDRLTRGLDDPDELREAILSSPTLSADVLRVVNSAAFALLNPISSIEYAVTYLGTNMVKGLVVQSAVSQVLKFETDVQKAAYMRVWRSAYIASAAAYAFAEVLRHENPSVYATRALLVSVGDLALISARPDLSPIFSPKSTLVGRIDDQQREIMANSAVLSSQLAREWKLPEDLYVALRHSLTPLTCPPDDNERTPEEQRDDILIYLACRIGDAVAYFGMKDVRDFNLFEEDMPDYFYLPDYLRRLDLGNLLSVLDDQKQSRRIRHTLSTFS